jgi:hypothetical protein
MRRHSFDIFSFVFGLVFVALGLAYLVNDGRWRFDAGPWVWPVVLLFGGAVVLLSTLRDDRQRSSQVEDIQPTGVAEIDEIEPVDPA